MLEHHDLVPLTSWLLTSSGFSEQLRCCGVSSRPEARIRVSISSISQCAHLPRGFDALLQVLRMIVFAGDAALVPADVADEASMMCGSAMAYSFMLVTNVR